VPLTYCVFSSASTSHCLPALLTSLLPQQAALLAQQEEEASGLQVPLHDCLIKVLRRAVKGGQPRYHAAVKAGRKVSVLLGPCCAVLCCAVLCWDICAEVRQLLTS
jgi:hypothetical protein